MIWKGGVAAAVVSMVLAGAVEAAQEKKPDAPMPPPPQENIRDKSKETEGIAGLWGKLIDKAELIGYIEVHYNNPELGTMSDSAPARADLHRIVFGVAYEFTDQIKLETEIEFEHGGSEIEIEELQLEYEYRYELGFVAGGLKMPIGLINPNHLPTKFFSVERPYVDHSLVPTTWMEPGIGAVARIVPADLTVRLNVVGGLNAAGFSALDGIRGGRGAGTDSLAEDLAIVARVEYSPLPGPPEIVEGYVLPPDPNYSIGASIYHGQADQDNPALSTVAVTLLELDGRYLFYDLGLEFRGQFVRTTIRGADSVSALVGQTIGEVQQGWYVEAAWHMLMALVPDAVDELTLFVRRERVDTQLEVPSGFARNGAAERDIWTFGTAYSPIPKVIFKLDVEVWKDGTNDTVTRFNLGFGLVF